MCERVLGSVLALVCVIPIIGATPALARDDTQAANRQKPYLNVCPYYPSQAICRQIAPTKTGSAPARRPLPTMTARLINDPKHWRDRAEEARAHADEMNDPEAKRQMQEIARGYDRLAERAGERSHDR